MTIINKESIQFYDCIIFWFNAFSDISLEKTKTIA